MHLMAAGTLGLKWHKLFCSFNDQRVKYGSHVNPPPSSMYLRNFSMSGAQRCQTCAYTPTPLLTPQPLHVTLFLLPPPPGTSKQHSYVDSPSLKIMALSCAQKSNKVTCWTISGKPSLAPRQSCLNRTLGTSALGEGEMVLTVCSVRSSLDSIRYIYLDDKWLKPGYDKTSFAKKCVKVSFSLQS